MKEEYVEIWDQSLRTFLEGMFKPEFLEGRCIEYIQRLENGKWIIKIKDKIL